MKRATLPWPKAGQNDALNSTAPGGESLQQFGRRVRTESAFLFAAVTEGPTAVIAHAGFMRVLLTMFYGVSEEEAWNLTKEYGSIVVLDPNLIRKFTAAESALQVFEDSSKKRSTVM